MDAATRWPATSKAFSPAAHCSITSPPTCAFTKKKCSAPSCHAYAWPTLQQRSTWSTATNSATACPATPATDTSPANSDGAFNAAWWASTFPFPYPWPGMASAAGKNPCSATCTCTEKKACAFTPDKKASCSDGPRAPKKEPNLPCPHQRKPRNNQAITRTSAPPGNRYRNSIRWSCTNHIHYRLINKETKPWSIATTKTSLRLIWFTKPPGGAVIGASGGPTTKRAP